ncbi:hypothetical protein BB987_08315 [Photorhabdus temperata]|nr:hypothetical protein BB987_08315 [Photorhabdus temperata]
MLLFILAIALVPIMFWLDALIVLQHFQSVAFIVPITVNIFFLLEINISSFFSDNGKARFHLASVLMHSQ